MSKYLRFSTDYFKDFLKRHFQKFINSWWVRKNKLYQLQGRRNVSSNVSKVLPNRAKTSNAAERTSRPSRDVVSREPRARCPRSARASAEPRERHGDLPAPSAESRGRGSESSDTSKRSLRMQKKNLCVWRNFATWRGAKLCKTSIPPSGSSMSSRISWCLSSSACVWLTRDLDGKPKNCCWRWEYERCWQMKIALSSTQCTTWNYRLPLSWSMSRHSHFTRSTSTFQDSNTQSTKRKFDRLRMSETFKYNQIYWWDHLIHSTSEDGLHDLKRTPFNCFICDRRRWPVHFDEGGEAPVQNTLALRHPRIFFAAHAERR